MLFLLNLYNRSFLYAAVLFYFIYDGLRDVLVGFDDRIGRGAFCLTKQTHESDVDVLVTETAGQMGHYAGSVDLLYDERAVFSGELYVYIVDLYDFDFPSADGFAANKLGRTVSSAEQDVCRVGMGNGGIAIRVELIG